MEGDRLPRKAYLILYHLDAGSKTNWASYVRMQLFQYGFVFITRERSEEVYTCVCVCVCVRACVRACVRVCVNVCMLSLIHI